MAQRLTSGDRMFRTLNYVGLGVLGAATLYPFWYVVVMSLSDPNVRTYLWPRELYYANYVLVFHTAGIWQAYLISVLRVLVAVPLMLLVTGGAAFALTRRELEGRKLIIVFFFVTMFFGGGLIPTYMVFRRLQLIDTFWVYIVPALFGVWTMIVMKTSFQSLPEGLVEAALIDGASYLQVFYRIVIPLSLPLFATLGLFSAVGHWNDWFAGAFYVSRPSLQPLQTFLQYAVRYGGQGGAAFQSMVKARAEAQALGGESELLLQMSRLTMDSLQAAYIVVSLVPLLLAYPWLQKFFVKGVLIGSIKE